MRIKVMQYLLMSLMLGLIYVETAQTYLQLYKNNGPLAIACVILAGLLAAMVLALGSVGILLAVNFVLIIDIILANMHMVSHEMLALGSVVMVTVLVAGNVINRLSRNKDEEDLDDVDG